MPPFFRHVLLTSIFFLPLVSQGHGGVLSAEHFHTTDKAADHGYGERTGALPTRDPRKLYVVEDETAFVASVCANIERAALANELPPAFLAKLIWKESRFDPNAISPAGAEGIAQFMPYTASKWGLTNSFEPIAAISASAKLLGYLWKGYGNPGLAAAAYNAGERRVDIWRAGRSGLPGETRDYVYSITGHKADSWKRGKTPDVTFTLDETRSFQAACTEFTIFKAPLQRRFANTYFNRGLSLTGKKNYPDAILRYSVAIRLKPDFPHAYNNRGIVYRKMGDFDTAIANYSVAIRLQPKYAAAYNNRGYAYRKLGRFDQAITDYDKAIQLKPDYVAALFNRGFAKAKLGHFDAAIADYSRVIKAQPKHALALYNRALAHMENGNVAGAQKDFDRAIAANAQFAKAYYRRAELLLQMGKPARAREDYRKSIALNANFASEKYKLRFE